MTPRYRIWIVIFAASATVMITPLAILTFAPPVRHLALSAVKGLYETQRRYALQRYLIEPNFEFIAQRLQQQLEMVKRLGSSKPRLSAEFIETVEMVMAHAIFRSDFNHLKPFLKTLAQLEPRAYLPQLWYGRAALETYDANAKEIIERAISLMPADDRAYRLAISLAKQNSNQRRLKAICARWWKAQAGGLAVAERHGKFGGNSQRRMVLHAFNSDEKMIVAGNFGITHDSAQRYIFRFSELVRHDSFDLRLAVFPGTRLTITDIELLVSDGWRKVPKPWFEIESSHAYYDEKGRILLNHRGDQTITFKLDPKVIVSRSGSNVVAGLAMNAKFERLALNTNPMCRSRFASR